MTGLFRPVIFATAPPSARLPLEDCEMAFLVERLFDREDHVLTCAPRVRHIRQILGDRLPGQAVAMQQTGVQQDLQDLRHTPGPMQVDRQVVRPEQPGYP